MKGLARDEHSSLFARSVSNKEKSFFALKPGPNVIKLYYALIFYVCNKLERLSLASLFSNVSANHVCW
jgi:hypothetical protein